MTTAQVDRLANLEMNLTQTQNELSIAQACITEMRTELHIQQFEVRSNIWFCKHSISRSGYFHYYKFSLYCIFQLQILHEERVRSLRREAVLRQISAR
jgi:hypothetical protein